MKPILKLSAGCGLLFSCAAAVVAGHDLITHQLAAAAAAGAGAVRLATVASSLIVHGITGVFVLPLAVQARRFGVPPGAARICVFTALAAVIGRTCAEAVSGVLIAGYPALLIAAATATMAMLLARTPGRRAWGVRGLLSGGGAVVAADAGRMPPSGRRASESA